jgi:hypothetical protein
VFKSILSFAFLTASFASAQESPSLFPRPYQPEVEPGGTSAPAPDAAAALGERVVAAGRSAMGHDIDRLYFDVDPHGTVWVRGRTYKASFSSSGAAYVPFLGSKAPRNFPLALQAESVTVGGSPVAFDASAPAVRVGDVVEYDRGAFRERYILELDSVEQTFVFDELPTRGEIAVTIGVQSELASSEQQDGFLFANELGGVHYGRAFAFDADSGKEPIESRLSGGRIELVAPAAMVARSSGAFVIDPVLATYEVADSGLDQVAADTAYDLTNNIWLTVYEEEFSAGDHDIRARRHTIGGSFSASDYIDFTGDDWRTPAVANNNLDDQFLVVGAVGTAPNREIWARTMEATASLNMSAQFQLGTDLSVRDMYAPDVGGESSTSAPTFYCVVWEREWIAGTDYNIVGARVRTDTTNPDGTFFVDGSGANHRNPSISNSSGNAGAALRDWNVVFEEEVSPTNRDIAGARIHPDGTLTATTFTVAASILDERNPSATSIAEDADVLRPWMACWQIDSGANDWDIRCRTFDGTTNVSTLDLSEQFPNVAFAQVTPSCDTALGQFVVVWEEHPVPLFASTDIRVATLYSLAGVLGVNEGDLSVAPGIENDTRPRVATQASSGSTGDDALVVFDRNVGGPNDVIATGYDLPNGGPVTAYCFGDGSGTACPCGNAGGAGRGCASSVQPAGARLSSSGNARTSADTFLLQVDGLPLTAPTLFFQGTVATNGSNGTTFGDGLRCASGTVIRLSTEVAVSGFAAYPSGGETDISVRGAIPANGAVRMYQAWYRNSAAFCTAATFNLTNGLRVQWIP